MGDENFDSGVLDELILLANRLGEPARDWVIPGEGSASIRLDDSTFAMTPDGASLATVRSEDLSLVSFAPLLDAVLSDEPVAAGELDDLLHASRLDPDRPQPSEEAFLHAYLLTLPDVLLVGHTHGESISGLLCSADGWRTLQKGGRLTPDEVIHCGIAPCCVSFARPGIELARAVRDRAEAFLQAYQASPKALYLQNQGFIALGGLAGEVVRTTAVADKSARILARALMSGEPSFLSPEMVAEIAQAPEIRIAAVATAPAAPAPPLDIAKPAQERGEPAEKTDKMPAPIPPADITEPIEPEPEEGDVDAMIAYYKKRVEVQPKNARAHYNLGLALLNKGLAEESVEALCRAVLLSPNDLDANVNLGVALAQKGAWNEAISQLDAALALAPTDPSIHYNLGMTYLTMGQPEDAIALFQESLRLDPTDPHAHLSLGDAFYGRGWTDEAIAEFGEAVRLDKDSAEAHEKLARALARAGKSQRAIGHFQQALQLGAKSADLHASLGSTYLQERHYDQAIGEYQEALFLDPDHLEAYCGFGRVLCEKGTQEKSAEYWDTARDAFHRALTLSPKHAASLTGLGILESRMGNGEAAVEAFKAAIDSDPNYAPAYEALAKQHKQMGKWREAWRAKREAQPKEKKRGVKPL